MTLEGFAMGNRPVWWLPQEGPVGGGVVFPVGHNRLYRVSPIHVSTHDTVRGQYPIDLAIKR